MNRERGRLEIVGGGGVASVSDISPLTREQRRSRRKRTVRCKTESTKRLPKFRLHLLALEAPPIDVERPRTRGDCEGGERPCPWVGCKHNLFLDTSSRTGALKFNFPDLAPESMPADASCALDIAETGATLERVGEVMNFTRERTRQIEVSAFARVRLAGGEKLAELAADGSVHKQSALASVATAGGGKSTDEGDDSWREGGVGRIGTPEEVFRAGVFRAYEREERERSQCAGAREMSETSLTSADEQEIARWANEIAADFRAGMPLRVAQAMANEGDDLVEEDPPVSPAGIVTILADPAAPIGEGANERPAVVPREQAAPAPRPPVRLTTREVVAAEGAPAVVHRDLKPANVPVVPVVAAAAPAFPKNDSRETSPRQESRKEPSPMESKTDQVKSALARGPKTMAELVEALGEAIRPTVYNLLNRKTLEKDGDGKFAVAGDEPTPAAKAPATKAVEKPGFDQWAADRAKKDDDLLEGVIRVLADLDEPAKAQKVAEEIAQDVPATLRLLRRLVEDKRVKRTGAGKATRYEVAQPRASKRLPVVSTNGSGKATVHMANGKSNGHTNGHAPAAAVSDSPLVLAALARKAVLAKELAAIDTFIAAVSP